MSWNKGFGDKTKLYTLDSGKIVTAKQVAKKLNCHISLARKRLTKSTDDTKVFGVVLGEAEKKKRQEAMTNYAKRRIHSRGMFDEMFVMAMKGI
jgi:CobQ-like glutamine amidotransferase family enzyme